jgi:phosphatidate cytidylyltransferase
MMLRLDPSVVALLPVLGSILAGALALIAGATFRLRATQPELVRELWLRYASWLAIAAAVLGTLAWSRTAWIVLVGMLSLAAFREYARAVGLWREPGFRAVVYAAIVAIHACVWWPYEDGTPGAGWYGLFMAMPVYATLAVLVVPIVRDRFEHMAQAVCLSLFGVTYLGWMLAHLGYLVNLPNGVGLVLLLLVLVSLHDVAAFVVGKVAGRHPLRPALSPRKTWEGMLGAITVVVLVAQMLGWLVPGYPRLHLLALGLLVGAGATLGDLALSTIKRDVGIKDWGTALPGHGGLLDRINSLIFTAPICFHYARFFLG